jgi:hypothetical protein
VLAVMTWTTKRRRLPRTHAIVICDLLVEKLAEITALVPFSTGTPVKQQLTSGYARHPAR